jgi:hypothetical protein
MSKTFRSGLIIVLQLILGWYLYVVGRYCYSPLKEESVSFAIGAILVAALGLWILKER